MADHRRPRWARYIGFWDVVAMALAVVAVVMTAWWVAAFFAVAGASWLPSAAPRGHFAPPFESV